MYRFGDSRLGLVIMRWRDGKEVGSSLCDLLFMGAKDFGEIVGEPGKPLGSKGQ